MLKNNLILVRLKTELPEEFKDLKKTLVRRSPDWQKIAQLCREYAFNAILKVLPCEPPEPEEIEDEAPEQLDLFAVPTPPPQGKKSPPPPEPEDDLPEQGLLF